MALAAIVVASSLVAGWWVFAVPILQSPDEDAHFDYAISEYQSGHLLRAGERPVEPDLPIRRSNPFTAYLEDRTGFDVIRHWAGTKAPPGYGDPAYYSSLNAGAPLDKPQVENPALVSYYPYGYYAATALWMAGVHAIDPTPLALFFGARLFSVALLAVTLLLTYWSLRELGLRRARSLLLTATTGVFPLTSFIASYIQPENLAWTATATALLSAIKLRTRRGSLRWLMLLSLGVGVLGVTKAQYVPYVLLPALGAALTPYIPDLRAMKGDLVKIAACALPAIALEATDMWVTGGRKVGFSTAPSKNRMTLEPIVSALHGGPLTTAHFLLQGAANAFFDFFVVGVPSLSFWGDFGWLDTPLVVGTVWTRLLIAAATVLLLVLVALRLAVSVRLGWRLWRRGRPAAAWSLLFGNPLVAAYMLFTLGAFAITVLSANSVALQGREWIVLLPGVFLTAVEFAPRALSRASARRAVSRTVLAGLLAYTAAGSVAAVHTIQDRYYGHGRQYSELTADGLQALDGGSGALTANVPSSRDFAESPPAVGQASVPADGYMAVAGWALPPPGRGAAGGVVLSVDGSRDFPAVYGDDGPGGRRDGFDGIVYLDGLTPGTHALTVKLLDADGRSYYAVGESVPFTVLPTGTKPAAGATR